MLQALLWLLSIEILGLIALPIAWRLFNNLPDRGYFFSKPLGLLLSGYLFWLAGSFRLLRNEAVSVLFVMGVVAAFAATIYRRDKVAIHAFLKGQRKHIILVEVLFIVSFALWALFRAYNPELDATERPMDLGFLNAILRSEYFPPNDPWLSGFAISYYYFGYLLMAMVAKLTAIPGAIAFNLAVSLLFAWTITGAFTLVYNLVAQASRRDDHGHSAGAAATLYGFLGSVLVGFMGNLHILFDMIRARGLGSEALWTWLDLKKIANAPVTGRWIPTDPPDGWWWWRASRVIHDRDLLGRDSEVIDEFPFFSFLLGDMHPHVLTLPFVLLIIGIAMNVLFGFAPRQLAESEVEAVDEADEPQGGVLAFVGDLWQRAWGILQAHPFEIGLWALCVGSLTFLNTWDFPIYAFVFLAALGVRRYLDERWIDWWELAIYAGWVLGLGILAYLPFFLGFRSQAGGILPVLYNVTRLPQYLIMFGTFIFVLISLAVVQGRDLLAVGKERAMAWLSRAMVTGTWARIALAIVLLPLVASSLAVFLVTVTPQGQSFVQELLAMPEVQQAVGGQSVASLIRQFAMMRLQDPWLFLLLVGLISALVAIIWYRLRLGTEVEQEALPERLSTTNLSALFVGILAVTGLLLTLATEFVYLRDFFGTRMNTIFKFWYQAWIQMAIASAFGVWYIMRRRQVAQYVWGGVFCLLLAIGLVYPFASMYSKAHQLNVEPTLNGIAYMERYRPGDYAAIQWLQENVSGSPTILEAPGGSYSQYGRVSSQTGLPTVLGWDFHEQQWRGTYEEPAKRLPDIERIYKGLNADEVLKLLEEYGIQYVYVGDLERSKYGLQPAMVAKFGRVMELVYEANGVSIYQSRGSTR